MPTVSSSNIHIAFVTASAMPKPDLDTGLLVDDLAQIGIRSAIVPWDAAIDWASVPLVVLRTPWDYCRRFDEFMAWASNAGRQTRLLNPFSLVQWNAHKSYLFDLVAKGAPIVPTTLFRSADRSSSLSLSEVSESEEIILKPAISSGARGAMRGNKNDPALKSHLEALLAIGDALAQPFVTSVATDGEVSLVYFRGEFSHAIRKCPASGDYRVQDQHGGTLHPHAPTACELKTGATALAAAPSPTLYARVDLVEFEGEPVIMELELIEPELFLRRSPEGTRRFSLALKSAL